MAGAAGRAAEDGLEMKGVILKQRGKVGNIAVVEEVVITTMKMITKDLPVIAVEVRDVMKAEAGTEMRKDIPKQPGKAGKVARVEEAVVMMKMTTIKGLHAAAVEEAAIMMKMKTTIGVPKAGVEGVVTTMKMKITIKYLRAAAAAAVDTMMRMTIIKVRHVAVVKVLGAVRAEVGMAMKRDIQKLLWKVGSIAGEDVVAAVAMMTITTIKGLHVAGAEVHAVGKAEDGTAMREDIPARPGKDGEIVIDFS